MDKKGISGGQIISIIIAVIFVFGALVAFGGEEGLLGKARVSVFNIAENVYSKIRIKNEVDTTTNQIGETPGSVKTSYVRLYDLYKKTDKIYESGTEKEKEMMNKRCALFLFDKEDIPEVEVGGNQKTDFYLYNKNQGNNLLVGYYNPLKDDKEEKKIDEQNACVVVYENHWKKYVEGRVDKLYYSPWSETRLLQNTMENIAGVKQFEIPEHKNVFVNIDEKHLCLMVATSKSNIDEIEELYDEVKKEGEFTKCIPDYEKYLEEFKKAFSSELEGDERCNVIKINKQNDKEYFIDIDNKNKNNEIIMKFGAPGTRVFEEKIKLDKKMIPCVIGTEGKARAFFCNYIKKITNRDKRLYRWYCGNIDFDNPTFTEYDGIAFETETYSVVPWNGYSPLSSVITQSVPSRDKYEIKSANDEDIYLIRMDNSHVCFVSTQANIYTHPFNVNGDGVFDNDESRINDDLLKEELIECKNPYLTESKDIVEYVDEFEKMFTATLNQDERCKVMKIEKQSSDFLIEMFFKNDELNLRFYEPVRKMQLYHSKFSVPLTTPKKMCVIGPEETAGEFYNYYIHKDRIDLGGKDFAEYKTITLDTKDYKITTSDQLPADIAYSSEEPTYNDNIYIKSAYEDDIYLVKLETGEICFVSTSQTIYQSDYDLYNIDDNLLNENDINCEIINNQIS